MSEEVLSNTPDDPSSNETDAVKKTEDLVEKVQKGIDK